MIFTSQKTQLSCLQKYEIISLMKAYNVKRIEIMDTSTVMKVYNVSVGKLLMLLYSQIAQGRPWDIQRAFRTYI